MDKTYNAQKIENDIYKDWENNGYFNPNSTKENKNSKETFTIVLPPPNVTGNLHLGHAVMLAIQDILIRFKRMQGYRTLWLPGTDHAAIATQNVVEKKLSESGKKKEDLGREKFIEECWKWTNQFHDNITNQIKNMGASVDWSRERFTLDGGITNAVYTVFKKMYDDELIYKGPRIVNWCSRCESTLADDEVDYKDIDGNFYYIKYKIKNSDDFLEIATTRPETMLGDSAVAVNPDDERYKNFIGKTIIVPIANREVKIISDEYVDKTVGTGALKVTPAHDPNDYKIGQKHKLEFINILNSNGTLNDKTGEEFKNLTILEAREKIIARLKKENLITKIEPIKHSVGHCYRCSTVIEPLISEQWFIDVNKKIKSLDNKSLKEITKEAVENNYVEIIPQRFNKTYFQWIDNLKDWCISRQIWWGHRLPVYQCLDCKEIIVSNTKPEKCPKCNSKKIKQDDDTLDTWFSSALWPFATLGWPDNNSEDFKLFYPNSVLETGYDILFFWVARMIMLGKYVTHDYPFKKVYLHGLVCDQHGQKMSKSKGNGIDPNDTVKTYGADAVRLSLVIGTTPGNNINIYNEKIAGYRNFINKFWNISRFIIEYNNIFSNFKEDELKNLENLNIKIENKENLNLTDKWIILKTNETIDKVTDKLNNYRIGEAGDLLYEFIWKDFADWYIEIFKNKEYGCNQFALIYSFINILKLLHPFAPFITEYIWDTIFKNSKLIISTWPQPTITINEKNIDENFEIVKNIISSIRNVRNEHNISPKIKLNSVVIENKNIKLISENVKIIKSLCSLESIKITDKMSEKDGFIKIVISDFEMYIELTKKEITELNKKKNKEIKFLEDSIIAIENKLNNKNFIEKAPKEIIEKEQEKYKSFKEKLEKIKSV